MLFLSRLLVEHVCFARDEMVALAPLYSSLSSCLEKYCPCASTLLDCWDSESFYLRAPTTHAGRVKFGCLLNMAATLTFLCLLQDHDYDR